MSVWEGFKLGWPFGDTAPVLIEDSKYCDVKHGDCEIYDANVCSYEGELVSTMVL